jgi:thiamine biosynthesis protein ThiS
MFLHINGERREFADGLSVVALVAQLGMKPDRVAVELNLEIVPRSAWEATWLKDGDKLEVVHFVGGGSTDTASVEQEKPQSPTSSTPARSCPTCGAWVSSKFCPECSEKEFSAADLSMRHFFSHALGEFFHFDSKMLGSFRLLFARPGFLTAEYLRGCRKPYLHPFQLFFIANLVYFLLQPYAGWSGLHSTLAIQMHMMSYSDVASRLVAQRIAAKGITLQAFSQSFDHLVDVQARSLVVLMVLIYAILLAILQWRKRQFFGRHLVFCLHFTAFWLIAIFLGFYGGSYWIMRLALAAGFTLPHLNWDRDIFFVFLVFMVAYTARALRVVYGDSAWMAILKALALGLALHYVLNIYRFILFLIGLYSA